MCHFYSWNHFFGALLTMRLPGARAQGSTGARAGIRGVRACHRLPLKYGRDGAHVTFLTLKDMGGWSVLANIGSQIVGQSRFGSTSEHRLHPYGQVAHNSQAPPMETFPDPSKSVKIGVHTESISGYCYPLEMDHF